VSLWLSLDLTHDKMPMFFAQVIPLLGLPVGRMWRHRQGHPLFCRFRIIDPYLVHRMGTKITRIHPNKRPERHYNL
jgi:hypothetical protein